MKRILILLLAACWFASCNDNTTTETTEKGTVEFKIQNSYDLSIASKATAELDDSFTVTILSSKNEPVFQGKYSELASGLDLIAGIYSIKAENCTQEQAHQEPMGQLRIAGGTPFTVEAKKTVTVAFTCTVTNTKVSVAYTDNFKATFKECIVEINEIGAPSRILAFDRNATLDTPCAFFNAPAAPQTTKIEVSVHATRNDDVVRTMTQEVEVKAAEWHKLTFDVGSNLGEGTFQINFDNSITDMISNHNIDPY